METLTVRQERGRIEHEENRLVTPLLQLPVYQPANKSTSNSTRELVAESEKLDHRDTYDQLNQLFVERDSKQKALIEARNLLGKREEELTDEEVANLASEVQYLVDTWLEEFERNVYGGKTLNEIFNLNRV